MTALQRALLRWYARNGRRHLPWRKTRNPYKILISECMLQQTQVDRVLPKYREFLRRFPTWKALADASTADVIRLWRGLGYNSRAVRLKRVATIVHSQFAGRLPNDILRLRSLPGIGPYTAAALRAFAFESDDIAMDTNVRRVMHRLFFGIDPRRGQKEIEAACARVVPLGRGHDWNSAMMDLGATICTARAPRCHECPVQKFCAAAPLGPHALRIACPLQKKQRFETTNRFARGRIVDRLAMLPPGKTMSLAALQRDLAAVRPKHELGVLLRALQREGLVNVKGRQVALSDER